MKPRVKTNCIANRYAAINERIIEFGAGSRGSGGLISIAVHEDGRITVSVYRHTSDVIVRSSEPEKKTC